MSKVGLNPLKMVQGVAVEVRSSDVLVTGPKGSITIIKPRDINISQEEGAIKITRSNDLAHTKSMHGTIRSLIANAIHGVSIGWEKRLEVFGTGYGVSIKNGEAVLKIGFSHLVTVPKKGDISFSTDGQTTLIIQGINKELIGQVAHEIRSIKPPDPYKGKGVRYQGEIVKLKVGKKAKTA
jgi:large subunit ribosomal protein L6